MLALIAMRPRGAPCMILTTMANTAVENIGPLLCEQCISSVPPPPAVDYYAITAFLIERGLLSKTERIMEPDSRERYPRAAKQNTEDRGRYSAGSRMPPKPKTGQSVSVRTVLNASLT